MPSLRNISLHRPSEHLIAVDDVSVEVDGMTLLTPCSLHSSAGRIVALRGANGAGKSTLLRVLAGRARPTSGSARVAGVPADERDQAFRRRVAVMIGLPPMAHDLTVRDHIALIASTWERTPSAVDTASREVLAEFGLTALGERYPHELSSGQTQLFSLSMVFVRPCDVLLLDEPEQRLDPDRVELLARAMLRRRDGGAAIVMATHSAVLADRTADDTLRLQAAS